MMVRPCHPPQVDGGVRPGWRGPAVSLGTIAMSFLLPLLWSIVLADVGVGSDSRFFSPLLAYVLTFATATIHFVLFVAFIYQ